MAGWYNYGQYFTNQNGDKIVLSSYEGGWNALYNSTDAINLLRYMAKHVLPTDGGAGVGMQGYQTRLWTNFRDNSHGVFPSQYLIGGGYPSTDPWSVLEDIWITPDPPAWAAMRRFSGT